MKYFFILFFILFGLNPSIQVTNAQQNKQGAEQILLQIKRLNQFGSVLYFAAHPDDENTRLITWLANEKGFNTAYQSLTRGDGGQNLIGTEIGTDLGIIRSHELIEARKIDGGKQFFSRAYDFGYSKNEIETFNFWNEDSLLADIVYLIRKMQPDVIINRFPPNSKAGHGHHTASAILSSKAFDLAANPNAYPEQLSELKPWQVKTLYFNASTWWEPDLKPEWHSDSLIAVNIGAYSPITGKSYTEIASESRSSHRSQGFGTIGYRGEQYDFLRYVKGEKQINIINPELQTWDRIKAPKNIKKLAENLEKKYLLNPEKPWLIAKDLATIHAWLKVEKNATTERKMQEIEKLLLSITGFHAEALIENQNPTVGSSQNISVNLINRSQISILVNQFGDGVNWVQPKSKILESNQVFTQTYETLISNKP